MKYYFTIFLFIFSFTFESPAFRKVEWNPNILYNYAINPQNRFSLNPYNSQFKLIDPQNYLNNNDKNKILRVLSNIENRQIVPIFCILESLQYPYNQNIKRFSEEFGELLFAFNKFYEDRIMLFTFSINDRLMHITTGKFTQKIFDDNDCKIFLNMVKPFMRNEDYFNGFYKMLQRVFREIEEKKLKATNTFHSNSRKNTIKKENKPIESNNSSSDSWSLVIVFIVIATILSCICCCGNQKEKTKSHVDENNDSYNDENAKKQREKELERERQKEEKEAKFGGASSSW